MRLPPLTAPLICGTGAMQPPRAVRFSVNSNARLCGEVEWIVVLPRHFILIVSLHQGAIRHSGKLHVDFSVMQSMVTPWTNKNSADYSPRLGASWKMPASQHFCGSTTIRVPYRTALPNFAMHTAGSARYSIKLKLTSAKSTLPTVRFWNASVLSGRWFSPALIPGSRQWTYQPMYAHCSVPAITYVRANTRLRTDLDSDRVV